MRYILILFTFAFLAACSNSSNTSNQQDQADTTETVAEDKKPVRKLSADTKRVTGEYYLKMQEQLAMTYAEAKGVKKIMFDYRSKKQELNNQGKWKGGENRPNRRQWQRDMNREIKQHLGEELFEQWKAYDASTKK